MRSRTWAALWLALGVLLWCGLFDIYVTRGADNYLRLHGEFELHLLKREPSMARMMAEAQRHAAIVASAWSGIVVAMGWATIWWRGGVRSRQTRGSL